MTATQGPDWNAFALSLAQNDPEADEVRILRSERLVGGWETDVFDLQIERRRGGRRKLERRVLRLYPEPDLADKAEREFQLMQALIPTEIPVPRVDRIWSPESPLGGPCFLMEHIAGPTLSQALESASASEMQSALRQLAALLSQLHALKPETVSFGAGRRNSANQADTNAPALLLELRQLVSQYGLEEFASVLARLNRAFEPIGAGELRVLHNDFHPGNILIRSAAQDWVIIDWSFAALGDPRLDLAWSALLVGSSLGDRARQTFLEGYQRQAPNATEHFEAFELLKLTSRLAVLATWLQGLQPIPVPKISVQTMRGDYRVHIQNVYERYLQITAASLPTFDSL